MCLLKKFISTLFSTDLQGFRISLEIFSDFKCLVVLFLFLAHLLEVLNFEKMNSWQFHPGHEHHSSDMVGVVMDLKSKALHSLNQWATCGHRGIFISSATSWTQTFRSFGIFFGMCRIDPTRVSHYVFNLFVLLNNQRLLIPQRKMEEAQVILTFLLLKYSPTKWPINTIYRGASAEKKYLYRENSVQPATREETNFFFKQCSRTSLWSGVNLEWLPWGTNLQLRAENLSWCVSVDVDMR